MNAGIDKKYWHKKWWHYSIMNVNFAEILPFVVISLFWQFKYETCSMHSEALLCKLQCIPLGYLWREGRTSFEPLTFQYYESVQYVCCSAMYIYIQAQLTRLLWISQILWTMKVEAQILTHLQLVSKGNKIQTNINTHTHNNWSKRKPQEPGFIQGWWGKGVSLGYRHCCFSSGLLHNLLFSQGHTPSL